MPMIKTILISYFVITYDDNKEMLRLQGYSSFNVFWDSSTIMFHLHRVNR